MGKLGRVVRQIRQRRGMTATEFAELLGVDHSTISRYEAGQRQPGLVFLGKLLQLAEGTEQNPILEELEPFLRIGREQLTAEDALSSLFKHADPGWLDLRLPPQSQLAEFISLAKQIGQAGKEIDPSLVQVLQLWLQSDTSDPAVRNAFEDAARFLHVALTSRARKK